MTLSFSKAKRAVLGAVAALTLGAAMVGSTAPAEAQWRGHWGGGWGGHRPAVWGGGWRYRPAYWGGYRYRPYYGGGAVAAGLVGGLALGALATAPYYGYGYRYRRAYYAPVAYGGDCWVDAGCASTASRTHRPPGADLRLSFRRRVFKNSRRHARRLFCMEAWPQAEPQKTSKK